MKTVLHAGCNAGTESFPKYFREQCNYEEFRLDGNLKNNLTNYIASGKVPDIVFLQIQSDTIDGKDTNEFIGNEIRQLKEAGSHVISWTGDLRNTTPRWMIEFAPNVSITMFSNYRDIEYCERQGINTGFLQCGIDTNIFTPDGEAANVPDIVFLANNYGNQFPLSGYRKNVVQTLRANFRDRFKVYGNGWGHEAGNVNSSQYEEAKVYRGCKIAISVSHYDVDGYFSDRKGRALCSGAFVLSHNYQGLDRDFEAGKHLDTFSNLNELIDQCNKYLNDEMTRNIIRNYGQLLASKEFSYQNIVKQIVQ